MRTPKTFFALLFTSLLLILSSCDWLNDEDVEPANAFSLNNSSPSSEESFIEVDLDGVYAGAFLNGLIADGNTSGTNKTSLTIGVDGNTLTVLDSLGSGYAGTVGSALSQVNGSTNPIDVGSALASWQVSFTGLDETSGLSVTVTGTITLVSNGVNAVANGGTIATILRLEGTWVESGGISTSLKANRAGPTLNISDFPFNED